MTLETNIYTQIWSVLTSLDGVALNVVAFHSLDPGSTPGRRTFIYFT